MDSAGSDDSFAWTNASSDNSDSIEDNSLKLNMKNERKSDQEVVNSSENEEFREKTKSKKAKKRKAISEESSSEYPLKKRIKTEPDSDSKETNVKVMQNVSDYLNLRVKEELESTDAVKPRKEKKKKRLAEAEISDVEINANVSKIEAISENGHVDHTEDYMEGNRKSKKEKKKKRSKREAEISDIDIDNHVSNTEKINGNSSLDLEYDTEEKIKTEDTVTTKPQSNHVAEVLEESIKHKKKKKKDKKSQKNDSANDSYSDSVNISAIGNDITEIEHTDNELVDNGNTGYREQNIQNKMKSYNSKKIADKIVFEDDPNDMDISMQSDSKLEKDDETKMSKQTVVYIKNNQNLQTIRQKIDKNTVISNNDEVWLFRCPREIDINLLKGVVLNDNGISKIKIGGKNYDTILEEEKLQLPIFTYNFNNKVSVIKNVKLGGCINLKRRLPKPHVPDNVGMVNNQTDFIPLPETKCRHPLFGVNYKKSIKIPAEVAERLKADINAEPKEEMKKKKKKHKKDKSHIDLEAEPEVLVSVKLEEELVSKKKKKRKHSQMEDSPPVKAKRIKHDPNCAETWESEKAIEETLFNF